MTGSARIPGDPFLFAQIFPSWPSTPEIMLLYQKRVLLADSCGVGFSPGLDSNS
jgi:hypothetical protein